MTASSCKDGQALADIKGQNINLVELSVSHYLLARALETVGLTEKDVKVVNTSDADIVAAFKAPDVDGRGHLEPAARRRSRPSPAPPRCSIPRKIPGEIIDLMVVNTETLKDNPDFGKALVGIWYETMALMQADTPRRQGGARGDGARLRAPISPASRRSSTTTQMFYDAGQDAVAFTDGAGAAEDHGPRPQLPASTTASSADGASVRTRSASRFPGGSDRSATRTTSSCASTEPT